MREMRKVLNEQGQVEGQRKEVNVREHVKTADSNKIIQFVQLKLSLHCRTVQLDGSHCGD